jgi:membrane associated rhomboid family serine protease
MELGDFGGDWDGHGEDGHDDDDGADGMQDDENYSSLLQNQQNSTWRSNLLPRSRFLELTVFKKMLAQGLHMTRHEGGRLKPTTVFADRTFRHLWWYKSVGAGVDTFAISSLLTVGTSVDPQSGSTRQAVIDITTISDEDYPKTLSLQFSGAAKGTAAKQSVDDDEAGQQEAQEIFFTCETLDLYHIVLDGFGMILEHAEAAVVDSVTGTAHTMTLAHNRLSWWRRQLLVFHQLYRPERHPNHPRKILRNGQDVEVLYSSEYVVEFNGQLMRLPNPFFGPGMNCRGKVAAYDPETENYTVSYHDGPFEHDEPPTPDKRNFPKGTVFEYVKRANLLLDLSANYTLRPPRAVFLVALVQLLGSVYASGSNGFGDQRPTWMMSFQVAPFEDGCSDMRRQLWRLWTYQFLPASWPHFGLNLIVLLLLGVPVNIVHGDVAFLMLTQGLGVPLGALVCGFSDAFQVVSSTLAGTTASVFALVGLYAGNLLLNFGDSTHGLLRREVRLALLAGLVLVEVMVRSLFPTPENDAGLHWGGLVTGIFFSVVVIRNLKMTHFERTFLIPTITWLGAAFVFFSIGWFAGTSPPTNFAFFPTTLSKPCCWRLYECDLMLADSVWFTCDGSSKLEAIPGATAVVKSDACSDYTQYLGLQHTAFGNTPP